ncbi:MAG: RDD family protein [Caldilineaceae bacterium]
MQSNTLLNQEYTIPTPENVSFGYEVVGIGNRFIAALLDTILLTVILGALNLLLFFILSQLGTFDSSLTDFAEEIGWSDGFIIAVFTLLQFIIYWGYYIAFELLWQGQTPGKRWTKIRVVRLDGNPVGFGEVAIRNLVRIIDFLPATYTLGLLTMFFSPNARRLGDYAAGTIVIKDKSMLTLEDVTAPSAPIHASAPPVDEADPLYTRYINIRALSQADYDLITELLKRYDRNRVDLSLLTRAAELMSRKLSLNPNEVSSVGSRKLLEEITEAYRRYG